MAARRKSKNRRQPAAATAQPAETAANALLADARKKADQILETSMREASERVQAANEASARLGSDAQAAGDEVRRAAAAEAGALVNQAREQAGRIRAEADGQAGELQAQAELAAQRTEKAARERADLLHRQAVEDAEKLATDARERSDRIGAHAVDEASRILHDARDQAEQLLAEARTAADRSRQIIESAEADARRITEEAKGVSARTVASAEREATSIREAVHDETQREEQRADALDRWSARAVIAAAVGLTASGEYELARMVGFDARVAWLLPLVIDVYVIQAFRRHRDILQAIALTIAANVIYHLADKGLFGVEKVTRDGHEPKWWLIALVASVASLILWRMHLITSPSKESVSAKTPTVGALPERGERPAEAPAERAHEPQPERPAGRPKKPKNERPRERDERAQNDAEKSAPKSVTDRRHERVKALYAELGKRPEWSDIRDALVAAKLANKTISRSSCQRIRDAVEKDHPKLAELGSPNVRALPGS